MSIRIVRLGSPREPHEGLRLGTVRRPPRGVAKSQVAARNFYDVWVPEVAPSELLLKTAGEVGDDLAKWKAFERRYRREMKRLETARLLDLLAALSHHTNFSVGCYCASEQRCHRSILRALLGTGHVRDRYGRHPLGQNLLMARRLIEAGVRLVSVTAWTGLPPGERFRNVQTWDMHGNGAGLGGIFGAGGFGLGWALPSVDEAVSALLEDLEVRGLLDTTLVVMVGEFGRTPRIQAGRDHWPQCYSAMLAGAGIRGGAVYGASDATAATSATTRCHRRTLSGAALFHALGVPAVRPGSMVRQPERGPTPPS